MLKKFILGITAVLVIFVVLVSRQPENFSVTRTATMSAPAEAVFAQVNDLHKWAAWSPWEKKDLSMKKTFEGAPEGTGAAYAWEGDHNVGSGRMTIVESRPAEQIRIKLEFTAPFKATNMVTFSFKTEGNQTAVSWVMEGKRNFISKALSLFLNMDKMVGGDFETGLAGLKTIVEKP